MSKLYLSKELYDKSLIEKAEHDYKRFALLNVRENKAEFVVKLTHCRYGEERTMKEFENYIIDLMCSKHD